MHLPRGLLAQDARGAEGAVGQVRDHEAAHVGTGRGEAACRRRADQFVGLRLVAARLVALGHQRLQRFRQRLAEARMLHPERLQQVLVDVVVEGQAGHALDDVAGQRGRVVRVGRRGAGGEDAGRDPVLERLLQRGELCRVADDQRARGFLQARGVGHDVAQGDRRAVERRDLEVEVLVDVGVEVELALLDQLHDRGPGEELGDRARAEQRGFRIDRLAFLDVGIAETALQQDLSILDDDHDGAGDVATLERVGQESIQPGIEVGAVEHRGRGGRGGGGGRRRRDLGCRGRGRWLRGDRFGGGGCGWRCLLGRGRQDPQCAQQGHPSCMRTHDGVS